MKKSGLNEHDDILLPIPPLGEFYLRAHPATNLSRPPKRKLTQGSGGIPAGECACWGCPKRLTCGRLKNSGVFTGLTHTPYMFVSSIANVVPRFECYFMEAILNPGLQGVHSAFAFELCVDSSIGVPYVSALSRENHHVAATPCVANLRD